MRGQFTFMTYVFICLGITSILPMYIYCLLIPIARFIFPPKKPGFLLQASYFQEEHHSELAKIQEMGSRLRTYLLSFILQMSWPINYLIFFLGIFYILHSIMFGGKRKQVLLLLSGDKIWETCVKYNTNCVIFQHLKFEMQGDPKFSEDSSPR